MSHDPLLRVEELSVQIQGKKEDKTLVRSCSLLVDRAEKIAIIGQSGSGKSTLALALTKLLTPGFCWKLSGKVVFEGCDLLKINDKQLGQLRWKKIAYLFQEAQSSLNPTMRLQKQLFEAFWQGSSPPLSGSEVRERSMYVLEKMGLPTDQKALSCYPHQWSGGMCQRFCLAMALAASPKLLIADEPTTALDSANKKQILSLLDLFVQESKAALILITHDLQVAERLCDRVVVMENGHLQG